MQTPTAPASLHALADLVPELTPEQHRLQRGRRPGLDAGLDGPVPSRCASAGGCGSIRGTSNRRHDGGRCRRRAPGSGPGLRHRHASDHRVVPGMARRGGPRRQDRDRLRLRLRRARDRGAETRRAARHRRRQRSAGARRPAATTPTQRRRRQTRFACAGTVRAGAADLLVANILAGPLDALARASQSTSDPAASWSCPAFCTVRKRTCWRVMRTGSKTSTSRCARTGCGSGDAKSDGLRTSLRHAGVNVGGICGRRGNRGRVSLRIRPCTRNARNA